jgi:hypothetical protein
VTCPAKKWAQRELGVGVVGTGHDHRWNAQLTQPRQVSGEPGHRLQVPARQLAVAAFLGVVEPGGQLCRGRCARQPLDDLGVAAPIHLGVEVVFSQVQAQQFQGQFLPGLTVKVVVGGQHAVHVKQHGLRWGGNHDWSGV